jgi:hypothetical protein
MTRVRASAPARRRPHLRAAFELEPFAGCLLVLPLVIFALLAREVRGGGAFAWDGAILAWLDGLSESESLTVILNVIIAVGGERWKPLPLLLISTIALRPS